MKKTTFLLLMLLLPIFGMAQEQGKQAHRPRFNQEEFRQRVENYITKEANLTEEEAKAFFPIYNEYKDKQRKIHVSISKLKKNAPNSNDEKAYEKCLMEMAELNAEMAGLDSVYYKKICKAISAQKFFKILNIEDRMHRKMLQNYNKPRPRGNKTRP